MKVVVTGGRDFKDVPFILRKLDNCWANCPAGPVQFAFGDAGGVDLITWAWTEENGIFYERFKADWETHGRAAGPIRNKRMLTEFKPDLVLAFPGGKGTADCVKQARAMGIEVREVK